MSRIAFAPADTGSATFTLEAPATNTNRTLNLPDEAGTVVAETSGNEVYRKQNILGTVSESSGVPTGAIIERGSNANGEFVKYADGTMICITAKSSTLTTGDSSSVSGFYRSSGASFTYPSAFSSVEYVSGFKVETDNTSGTDFVSFASSNKNYLADTTGISPVIITGSRSGDSSKIKVLAIGRWF